MLDGSPESPRVCTHTQMRIRDRIHQTAAGAASFALLRAAMLGGLLIGPVACGHESPRDLRVIAPAFAHSEVRFTSYDLMPVGAFADKRGAWLPFVDANHDGSFDPDIEASGRCDRTSRQCWIDDHRLRAITLTADCPATAGAWLIGNVYDHEGRNVKATLCDERGVCGQERAHAFENTSVNAIWTPGVPAPSGARTLSLRAGSQTFAYRDVELPAPIHLVRTSLERGDGLRVALTADQRVDMIAVRVTRGRALQWSSARDPGAIHADGSELSVELSQELLESCDGTCEADVQLAHVWRDDHVLSVSQVEHRIF